MKASVSMWAIALSVVLILHGLVHLLYAGHSLRWFELRPGLTWPDGGWAFSRLVGDEPTRLIAAAALAVVALGLAAGGLGLIWWPDWGRPVVLGAAALSSVLYLALWNGRLQALDDQGGVGVLINLALLAALFLLKEAP